MTKHRCKWFTICGFVILVLGISRCEQRKADIIEISESSFEGGYPAVWFSPSTGEIVPVGEPKSEDIETPPAEKYVFWIEPGDPEFSTLGKFRSSGDTYGVKFIGTGAELFENTTSSPSGGFAYSFGREAFDANSVVFIRTPSHDYLVQMLAWRRDYLKFKYRKL